MGVNFILAQLTVSSRTPITGMCVVIVMSSVILCLLILHSIYVLGISVSRSAALVIRFIPIKNMLTRMVQIVVISFLASTNLLWAALQWIWGILFQSTFWEFHIFWLCLEHNNVEWRSLLVCAVCIGICQF